MRVPMAFFAGAGTVLVAIAVGLSGGLIVANVMSPPAQKQQTSLLERRALDDAARALNTQQVPIPYVAATTTAAAMAAGAAAQVPPAEGTTAGDRDAKQSDAVAAKAAAPSAMPVRASAPEDANAKAGEADLRRPSDNKRKADRRQTWPERQQSEDRRQWGDREHWGDRQWSDQWRYRDQREHDNEQDAWRGSSRKNRDSKDRDHKVRDDRSRDYGVREYRDRNDDAGRRDDFDQPILQSPRIRIFGADD